MKNKTILISIIFSIIGAICCAVFIPLNCLGVVEAGVGEYLMFALYFVVVWLPPIVERLLHMEFYTLVDIFYQIFMVLAILVGSVWRVYTLTEWYDKFVHVLFGALFGFMFYNFFSSVSKTKLSPLWLAIFSFCFAMMIGGMWEICEYTFDGVIAGQNTQRWEGLVGRDALFDTMIDLVCDLAGSLISAVIVFFSE